jgi:hypothetical protein
MTLPTASALLAFTTLVFCATSSLATEVSDDGIRSQKVTASGLVDPDIHPLEDIKLAVEDFLLSTMESDSGRDVDVKDLDRRLRLARCVSGLVTG